MEGQPTRFGSVAYDLPWIPAPALPSVRLRPRIGAALRDQAEELRAFREIATLVHVPLEPPPDTPTDWLAGAAAARGRGMRRLAERLERLAET